MLWMSPRKRGSGWARTNKVRIEQLLADGLMAPAGLALIEEARRDGSWTLLDDVENLIVPDDLAAALDAHPRGPRALGRTPRRSVRRGALDGEWSRPSAGDPGQRHGDAEFRPRHRRGQTRGPGGGPAPDRTRSRGACAAGSALADDRAAAGRLRRRGRLQGRLAAREQPGVEQLVQLLAGDALGERDELRRRPVAARLLRRPGLHDAEEVGVADLPAQGVQGHGAAVVDRAVEEELDAGVADDDVPERVAGRDPAVEGVGDLLGGAEALVLAPQPLGVGRSPRSARCAATPPGPRCRRTTGAPARGRRRSRRSPGW